MRDNVLIGIKVKTSFNRLIMRIGTFQCHDSDMNDTEMWSKFNSDVQILC